MISICVLLVAGELLVALQELGDVDHLAVDRART